MSKQNWNVQEAVVAHKVAVISMYIVSGIVL